MPVLACCLGLQAIRRVGFQIEGVVPVVSVDCWWRDQWYPLCMGQVGGPPSARILLQLVPLFETHSYLGSLEKPKARRVPFDRV